MASPSVHVPLLFFTEIEPAASALDILPEVISTLVTVAVAPELAPVIS